MTKQNIYYIFVVSILLIFLILIIVNKNEEPENIRKYQQVSNQQESDSTKILTIFDSMQCPHCRIVDEYIKENKDEIYKNFEIHKKGIESSENLSELNKLSLKCNIGANIGIPLMWDGEKCYVGDAEIIVRLEQLNNLQ